MGCYVLEGYWDDGYTVSDICGIVPPPLDPIYSAAWMPVIKVDRKGRRIDPDDVKRRAVEAVSEESRDDVEAVFDAIADAPTETMGAAVWDGMADELRALMAMIPAMELTLLAEIRLMADTMASMAEDERDLEMLMLAI
jgi:hypothetical protein